MEERDGGRDFDPILGDWRFHLRRLMHPLTGSNDCVEFEGESHCGSIWSGRGQLEELSLTNLTDGSRMESLTLRLYNANTREWSLYFTGSANPGYGSPQKGKFVGGKGEFLDRDVVNGQKVIVRWLWSGLESSSPHFELAFSTDEGKTWETNWITDQTRK